MATTNAADIVDLDEVQAIFRLTDRYLTNRFIRQNAAELKAFKVGRNWLVPRDGIESYIRSRQSTPQPTADGRARRSGSRNRAA